MTAAKLPAACTPSYTTANGITSAPRKAWPRPAPASTRTASSGEQYGDTEVTEISSERGSHSRRKPGPTEPPLVRWSKWIPAFAGNAGSCYLRDLRVSVVNQFESSKSVIVHA